MGNLCFWLSLGALSPYNWPRFRFCSALTSLKPQPRISHLNPGSQLALRR